MRKRQQAFSGMLAWSAARFNLASGGEARHAEGLYVSGGFFEVLGVRRVVGRSDGVERARNRHVQLWRSLMCARPAM